MCDRYKTSNRQRRRRAVRRPFAIGLLVTISLSSALVAGELVLRYLDFSYYWSVSRWPERQRGWTPAPGARAWQRLEGEAFVQINRAGFRDRERTARKPPGSLRIAVLGDSFTAAVQVPIERTFWSLLEGELRWCPALKGRNVEVLGFGVSGYSTAQALLTWRHAASRYDPDLVLLAFFSGNDLAENTPALDSAPMRPYLLPAGERADGRMTLDVSFLDSPEYRLRSGRVGRVAWRALAASRLFQALDRSWDLARYRARPRPAQGASASPLAVEPGIDPRVYRAPADPAWGGAWEITEQLLLALHRETRAGGSRLVVATVTTGLQVHPEPGVRAAARARLGVADLRYPERRVAGFGARHGFSVVELATGLQSVAALFGIHLHGFENTRLGVGHWNENGHSVAAQLLSESLCSGELTKLAPSAS